MNTDNIDSEVERAVAEDCLWFKLYINVDKGLAREVVRVAHEKGLRVTGHVNNIGINYALEICFEGELTKLPSMWSI